MRTQPQKNRNPKSFRPTESETKDIELLKKDGLCKTNSGVMHRALERGFYVLKMERGLIKNAPKNEDVKV